MSTNEPLYDDELELADIFARRRWAVRSTNASRVFNVLTHFTPVRIAIVPNAGLTTRDTGWSNNMNCLWTCPTFWSPLHCRKSFAASFVRIKR